MISPPNGAVNVSTSPTYSWNPASNALSYALQVSTDPAFGSFEENDVGIIATSFSAATPLANNTTYYWRVYADNGAGITLASGAPWSFTTIVPPPGAFSLSSPADGAVDVPATPSYSWTASSFATSYTLQVSTSPSFATFVVNQSGLVGTGATPNVILAYSTVYHWRMIAVNVAGSTLATGAPFSFTTAPPPDISLSTSTLSFSEKIGGPPPASQIVMLSNPSGSNSPLHWVAISNAPWLQVSPLWGVTGAGTDNLTISVTDTQAEAWTTATSLTGAPAGREDFSMVWTGKEMIVWGGTTGFGGAQTNGGTKYDPTFDTWTGTLSTVGAPSARRGHRGVWTGKEMIVWGGYDGTTFLNDGHRYDPRTDTWTGPISTTGAPTGRFSASAVWTGSKMIIWGGQNGTYFNDGAAYDPSTDTWSPITTTGAPTGRWHAAAAWTGTEMLIFGG